MVLLLATMDGGRWPSDQVILLPLAATVIVAGQRGLWQGWVPSIVVGSITYGAMISLLFAGVRPGWVAPFVTLAIGVAAGIGALRLWVQPWGPRLVATILATAAALAWYEGLLAWWGGALGRSRWLALSFENQSGPLMSVVAFVGLGLGMTGSRVTRVVGAALGGLGLAGTWLSGSRGTLILLVPVLILVTLMSTRQEGGRRTAVGFAAAFLVGLLLVVALTSTTTGDAEDTAPRRIFANVTLETANLQARFGYWRPTVDMVLEAPLVGTGPGSYPWSSRPYYPPDVELTSSPHNVYLEALSERGLVGGLPIWLTALAVVGLVSREAFRPAGRELPAAQRAARLAGVGSIGILGAHAGMDFDWDYPVLFAALTIAIAIVYALGRTQTSRKSHEEMVAGIEAADVPDLERHGGLEVATDRRSRLQYLGDVAALGALAVTVLAFAGVASERGQTPAPWDLRATQDLVVAAVQEDQLDTARQALNMIERWSPDAWSKPVLDAVVAHAAGEIKSDQLAAVVEVGPASANDQLLVIDRLFVDGSYERAHEILEGLRPVLEDRLAWFTTPDIAQELVIRSLEIAEATAGCPGVSEQWSEDSRWLETFGWDAQSVQRSWEQGDAPRCVLSDPASS